MAATRDLCPATTTEYNGSRMACILEREHTASHTDGCCEWNDPWSATGEIDVDQHAIWLREQKELEEGE